MLLSKFLTNYHLLVSVLRPSTHSRNLRVPFESADEEPMMHTTLLLASMCIYPYYIIFYNILCILLLSMHTLASSTISSTPTRLRRSSIIHTTSRVLCIPARVLVCIPLVRVVSTTADDTATPRKHPASATDMCGINSNSSPQSFVSPSVQFYRASRDFCLPHLAEPRPARPAPPTRFT